MGQRLPNGAAETLEDRAREAFRAELGAWAKHFLAKVSGDLASLPHEASRTLDHVNLATTFYELGLHAAMLGALDVRYEVMTGRAVSAQFVFGWASIPGVGIPGFTRMPFREAIGAFVERKSVTKREWFRMTETARRKAFTVAHLAKKSAVEVVRQQVDMAMAEGWTVSSFKKDLAAAFDTRGISPLAPHHVETIIRTNTATAHGEGRKLQQTSATVRETHPFWEYDAILDKTTRATHRAADRVLCRADDPIWSTAYPPNGFRCRCGVVSRRKGDAKPGYSTPLAALPDKGFSK